MKPTIDSRRRSGSGAAAPTDRAKQPEREQPEERGATAEILGVLPIEGPRVAAGIVGGWVALVAARAAATPALPAHRVAVAREAETMTEQATAEHLGRGYTAAVREPGR